MSFDFSLKKLRINFIVAAAALSWFPAAPAAEIQVIGLMGGKAVLVIDGGRPRTLSVGQTSPEGVKLISTDSGAAVVEIAGKRQTLSLGQAGYAASAAPSSGKTVLVADSQGHFITTGTINGVSVRFVVDTGATFISMSSEQARRLGLSYAAGERGLTTTANGVVPTYRVKLDTVRIGDITLHAVDGAVLEGPNPPIVLLGMSFLNRVEMKRDGESMTLTKRF
ncbi:MAG: TIGR02281 family clan AA aspartic protease [Betaproteobacteria bacterium]|nr:TIGR02281 family clan AA aspartic protease [Betaproteobacteria bacterium]